MNRVTLMGRLGQDPELKYTPSAVAVCSFSIATSKKYKGKDGNQSEKTEWHRIVAWDKLAEICNQYLSKGSQVLLEGEINYRNFENKEGAKVYITEIRASSVDFIGSSKQESQGNGEGAQGEHNYTADDIPF